jgi:hypothetical protein
MLLISVSLQIETCGGEKPFIEMKEAARGAPGEVYTAFALAGKPPVAHWKSELSAGF